MPEPRIDSLSELQFRSRSQSGVRPAGPPDRFWTGVAIFILVAMAYPFYSYAVQTYLLARDVEAAAEIISSEVERAAADARREVVESQRAAAAEAVRQRQRGVSVAGTTTIGGKRIVIVNLGRASLQEAKASICTQAERYFREPLAGEELHIQRHRGSQPAVDAGRIICD